LPSSLLESASVPPSSSISDAQSDDTQVLALLRCSAAAQGNTLPGTRTVELCKP